MACVIEIGGLNMGQNEVATSFYTVKKSELEIWSLQISSSQQIPARN